MKIWPILGITLVATYSSCLLADWTDARCDIYPKGEDKAAKMIACTFAQRQGAVSITRSDGIIYELTPVGEKPGNYVDENGDRVYRQGGLGSEGLIFRFPKESVFVYWDATTLQAPADANTVTAPFTTGEFDATTLLPCRAAGDSEFGSCPAGILRMEDKQASITIRSQNGEQFTINFMTDYVNATNGEVKSHREGDTWIVTTANGDLYKIPLAAIEGG